jgi:CRISPR-associated endonuclease/helicase Cas3
VLRKVKDRLKKGVPCRLVATQVVEAGVDLDFPMVLRAMGPLDRIVQAAGRCNREHKLPGMGRVVVFEPEGGKLPRGVYETATAITRGMLDRGKADLFDPSLYREYFRSLFTARDLDTKHVQEARKMFDFPEVAERFRLIEDDTVPVIVRYPPDEDIVESLLKRLRRGGEDVRKTKQMLQPYIVDVRRRTLADIKSLVTEARSELYVWGGKYDDVKGMVGLGPGDMVV